MACAFVLGSMAVLVRLAAAAVTGVVRLDGVEVVMDAVVFGWDAPVAGGLVEFVGS